MEDPTKLSDEQLISWQTRDQLSNVPLAELTRRNTIAINSFNRVSTFLAVAMIILASVSVIIAIFK